MARDLYLLASALRVLLLAVVEANVATDPRRRAEIEGLSEHAIARARGLTPPRVSGDELRGGNEG